MKVSILRVMLFYNSKSKIISETLFWVVICSILHLLSHKGKNYYKFRTEKISLKNLTPLSAQKSGNLPEDFEMEIQFKSICECDSETSV